MKKHAIWERKWERERDKGGGRPYLPSPLPLTFNLPVIIQRPPRNLNLSTMMTLPPPPRTLEEEVMPAGPLLRGAAESTAKCSTASYQQCWARLRCCKSGFFSLSKNGVAVEKNVVCCKNEPFYILFFLKNTTLILLPSPTDWHVWNDLATTVERDHPSNFILILGE